MLSPMESSIVCPSTSRQVGLAGLFFACIIIAFFMTMNLAFGPDAEADCERLRQAAKVAAAKVVVRMFRFIFSFLVIGFSHDWRADRDVVRSEIRDQTSGRGWIDRSS